MTKDKTDLHLWKFTPVAAPDHAWWQGRDIWDEIVVVAGSAGEAQVAAVRFDNARIKEKMTASDRQHRHSGLDDPRLYRVDRVDGEVSDGLQAGDVVAEWLRLPGVNVDF